MSEIISKADAIAAGRKWYFSGAFCKRGHVCARAVRKSNDCLECKRLGQAKHYRRNAAAIGSKVAAYKKSNPAKVVRWAAARNERLSPEQKKAELARLAAWTAANPERRRETENAGNRRRRAHLKATSPETLSRKKAAEHLKNQGKNNERTRKWKVANPDKVQASNSKRRAVALGAGGSHTAADISDIFRLQNRRCAYCKVDLSRAGKRGRHVDHVLPLTKGGHDGRSNLQILCQRCNNRKHAKRPEQFARELGMLI
jgi:5-methylcytosine-specific restriction endonuclease McrA